ncbi:MAG: AAA family ATPase [bacterium]|nr:AAA family ATPase [bacterium]
MIIGLTGSYAAGKDTVGEYLVSKGFIHHSLSDLIREELKTRGISETRESLIRLGTEVRQKSGSGEWARRAIEAINGNHERNSVVTSIRNPEEVVELKKHGEFHLWFVDAPDRLRYERMQVRQRQGDTASFEDFLAKEKIENSADPAAQQLQKVADLADVEIINDKNFESLYSTVDELLLEQSHGLNKEAV